MKMKKIIAITLIFLLLLITTSTLNGCHETTKNFGGTMTIELEPGQKLEEITWKDDTTLWILTRPFREDEKPETHMFYADTEFGVFEGKVIIIEREKE